MIVRKTFTTPLYFVPYEIAFVTTMDEAKKVDPEFGDHCSARTHYDDNTNDNLRIVFHANASDEREYAHECIHLANRICIVIGYTPDRENDEPYAYLVGHLVATVIEARRAYDKRLSKSCNVGTWVYE